MRPYKKLGDELTLYFPLLCKCRFSGIKKVSTLERMLTQNPNIFVRCQGVKAFSPLAFLRHIFTVVAHERCVAHALNGVELIDKLGGGSIGQTDLNRQFNALCAYRFGLDIVSLDIF